MDKPLYRAFFSLTLCGAFGCVRSSSPELSVSGSVGAAGLGLGIASAPSDLRVEGRGEFFETSFSRPSVVVTRLPRLARGAFGLRHGLQQLGVSLVGASEAPMRNEGGLLTYDSALGLGTKVTQRVTTEGTEDFVRFERAPGRPELRYEVTLEGGVAGLRLMGNTLEFLDARGTPQMRVNPPYGVDAKGERFPATLSVEGAAVDTDPRGPWGRSVTAPGTRRFVLVVRWSEHVAYPAVVDPAWVATGNTANPSFTYDTFANRLTSGRVLYSGSNTNITELYDPATGTWSSTGPMPFAYSHKHRVSAGDGGLAWAIAGSGTNSYSTAKFDEATGVWTAAASLPLAAQGGAKEYALTYMGGNKFFFADAVTRATHIYNIALDSYTAVASLPAGTSGFNAGAYKFADGRVWVEIASFLRLSVYNPATNAWSQTATIPSGDTNCANIFERSDGKVMWYGAGGAGQNFIHLYDPTTDSFSASTMTASPSVAYMCSHLASVSYGTKHYIGGGRFLYDEATNTDTDLGGFPSGVPMHQAMAKLLDGRAIAVAGADGIGHNNQTDVLAQLNSTQCSGAVAGTTTTTPVYDPATKRCAACTGDNASAATLSCPTALLPSCSATGACVACSATNLAACTGITPTCNVGAGVCAGADGDNAGGTPQACPTAAAPFALADGSCGSCKDDGVGTNGCGNKAPAHAGAFCGPRGACSNLCTRDAQCGAGNWCSSDVGKCVPVLPDGTVIPTVTPRDPGDPALGGLCTAANSAAVCTSGVCSTVSNTCGLGSDAGAPDSGVTPRPDSGVTLRPDGGVTPSPDGGLTSRPDGGVTPSPDGGSDGIASSAEVVDDGSVAGGGWNCDAATGTPMRIWSLGAFGAMLMSRRRRVTGKGDLRG